MALLMEDLAVIPMTRYIVAWCVANHWFYTLRLRIDDNLSCAADAIIHRNRPASQCIQWHPREAIWGPNRYILLWGKDELSWCPRQGLHVRGIIIRHPTTWSPSHLCIAIWELAHNHPEATGAPPLKGIYGNNNNWGILIINNTSFIFNHSGDTKSY